MPDTPSGPSQFKDPSDQGRGLWDKFKIERTDGQSAEGEFHHGCHYFPLDLTHDPHALHAIRAYAESCRDDNPQLAAELLAVAERGQRACKRCGSTRVTARRPLSGVTGLLEDTFTVHCRSCGHHEYRVP